MEVGPPVDTVLWQPKSRNEMRQRRPLGQASSTEDGGWGQETTGLSTIAISSGPFNEFFLLGKSPDVTQSDAFDERN